jgi:hypothetical protein
MAGAEVLSIGCQQASQIIRSGPRAGIANRHVRDPQPLQRSSSGQRCRWQ